MYARRTRLGPILGSVLGPLLGLCLATSCSSGGGANPPPAPPVGADLAMVDPGSDLAMNNPVDMATMTPEDLAGRDLAGVMPDLSMAPPDLATMPPDLAGSACTPGSYRCGAGNAIEICN